MIVVISLATPFVLAGAQYAKATVSINAFLSAIVSRGDRWEVGQAFGFDGESAINLSATCS